ncbi:MAG: response regulator transcription factor [Proteobacteria bacterium]|nr:response regulator transcription factor [Pseudomonadota bacterium]
MVIVCSVDTKLIKLCAELFGRKNDIKQLIDVKMLKKHASAPGDLLVIDIEHCREQDIPVLWTPSVVIATILEYAQAMRLLQKGVRGYGNRHMHRDNFLQAAGAVRSGQVWLPPSIITRMITSIPGTLATANNDSAFEEPLSKREDEVAQLVTQGLSNKEIAEKIFVSVRTVKAHLTSIFAKTGYRDRLELAVNMKQRETSLIASNM